jgi:hypothetical protein
MYVILVEYNFATRCLLDPYPYLKKLLVKTLNKLDM